MAITVRTTVNAPLDKVWDMWTGPAHITRWCFASDDWAAPEASNDLRVGGSFRTVMAAKDGSAKFDFAGTYNKVEALKAIEYDMTDGRHVSVTFMPAPGGVKVEETFDPETENPEEMQRAGWQAILENFKRYVEASI